MVTITLDLFSGRPNPSFTLPEAEADALLAAVASSPGVFSTEPGPSILGFRGVIVTLDAAEAARQGVPEQFRLGDGLAPDVRASADLAERVLAQVPPALGFDRSELTPLTQRRDFPDLTAEPPAPEATGQRDVGPGQWNTVADGACSVEIGRFNPVFWNAPNFVLLNNNCYAYGCDMRTSTFPQPGRYSGQMLQPTLASVRACALADGLVLQGNCMPAARVPRWLVALVTTPDNARNWDYHWYRKQQDGFWGHKPGETLATNHDQSGNVIVDPQTCDRGRYTVWGGYLYVPQTASIS